ncbi:hypothetical protein B0H17DRAFT_946088 [Mycena rosella]|uniref:Tc1-like transposase DDE domain-containing protein n=1 Tax=Mycena rosella TaxID=1033263 RepID=A0AAD7D2N2_MYCRO|nr:hypothetical protein B0H17DRAFT_946088 [Mycena rosella]
MPNRRISDDLKEAALRLQDRGRDTTKEILQIICFSRSTLHRTCRHKVLTGHVTKAAAHGRGRPRTLAECDADYLVRLAKHKSTTFLDEYRDRLERYRFLPASLSTIHCTFIRARMSLKQIQKMAAERTPLSRADYSRRISIYPTDYLICIDEVSKDDRTYNRIFGHAEGIIGARVVEGSLCRKTYVEFLRDSVVSFPAFCQTPEPTVIQMPLTTPYPGPRSVLVMDNAHIHHVVEVEELALQYGELHFRLP